MSAGIDSWPWTDQFALYFAIAAVVTWCWTISRQLKRIIELLGQLIGKG